VIVGFQGEPGAFSDEAARSKFAGAQTRGYATFEGVARAVARGEVDCGLLPLENTVVGPIVAALAALERCGDVCIAGDVAFSVEQCLIGVRGASLEGLSRVRSHPVALAQCGNFLVRYPNVRPEITEDTAGAVREIVECDDPSVAAIGPALAADRYGAVVLARSIADRRDNVTRFAIIERAVSAAAECSGIGR